MSLAVVHSRALLGVEAPEVTVEVHLANGLPSFTLVGLADTEVKESRERVRAALATCGLDFPANKRITVNLAPADLPKESGRFDLPIALGILAAAGHIDAAALAAHEFAGELSLAGELRPVRGALALGLALARRGPAARSLVLPAASAAEAALIDGVRVFSAAHLLDVVAAMRSDQPVPLARADAPARSPAAHGPDLRDVKGQAAAKRALEVAAAGGHALLMVGPPGSGKSMLAQRLPGLLPPLTTAEAVESGAMRSLAGEFSLDRWGQRVVRSPHHSASAAALVGGGSPPRPGEISLAHHGVLFLDELPEFPRAALEALREPLETGRIQIARAARQMEFPARFQLVAAMNPWTRVAFFQGLKVRRKVKTEREPETLGEHLKRERLKQGLRQSDLAHLLGASEATILHWERGQTTPAAEYLPRITVFLGYDPAPPANDSIGERMAAYRRTHGLSIKAAAKRAGVDEGSWGRWERDGIPWARYRERIEALLRDG